MTDLNNLDEIKKIDPKNVFGSTEMLADQCGQVWEDAKKLNFPKDPGIKNIVFSGMGGSSYGAHVIKSLFSDVLKVPVYVVNDYHLPAFADSSTLVFLTSYSGTTEETLSCAKDALERGCKIAGLTSGGELGEILKSNNCPHFIFESKHNPSGQPRLGTGYIVLGTIAMFNKLGLLEISDDEVKEAISQLKTGMEDIKSEAQKLAVLFKDKIPFIISAEFLEGNSHILRNQLNETAKSFSDFEALPELNHHLMEGLKYPTKDITMLFVNSPLFSDKLQKRVELTKDVVQKNGLTVQEYKAKGNSKIAQVLNVLSFGGFLSLYLALLYNEDPSLIPWVDYFKEQLKK